jgi:nitrile hydratase
MPSMSHHDAHEHGHHHDHDHDPDHPGEHGAPLSGPALRVKALESLLIEKGLVDPVVLDQLIDRYETKVGPRNGARVVARAWADAAFKRRLLEDTSAAMAEFGYTGRQGENMVVVENTPAVHNMVVCTLCSCYPWPVLGLPPVWDSTAELRYLVLPMRPPGTENMNEDDLAALVTRDSMIGTGVVRTPAMA